MTRSETLKNTLLVEAIESERFSADVVSHPSRASMGQFLASRGELVFEGELLEQPLSWHPSGTRH